LLHPFFARRSRRLFDATALALLAMATAPVLADDQAAAAAPDPQSTQAATAPISTSTGTPIEEVSGLTFHGVTLYGTVDLGVAYQTHGAQLNLDSPQGLNYLLGKASNGPVTSLAPNGLGPSIVGLNGDIPLQRPWP
jgi:hypothetical protein